MDMLKRALVVVLDMSLIFLSYMVAELFLRETVVIDERFLMTYAIAVCVYSVMFLNLRVYKPIIQYTCAREYVMYFVLAILSGITVSIINVIFNIGITNIFHNILTSLFVGGFMILVRLALRRCYKYSKLPKDIDNEEKRILIIGAGDAGHQVIREVLPKIGVAYKVVGIIDDNKEKIGSSINGINIIGDRNNIISFCEKTKVNMILFAIANIDKREKAKILNLCSRTKANIKVIPDIKEILLRDEPLEINSFGEIKIEDLLGRAPIELKNDEIKQYMQGKIVLVTGGGGSIGSELCRQVSDFNIKQLIMLDIYENTLYETELELRRQYPNLKLTSLIASVRDEKRINEIFDEYQPDIVFHAAAHKHVPLMETSPIEAIKNNVFGTYNVVRAANSHNVKKFILVSTDKAVNPTSIMGATKRICEMIIQMQNVNSKTNFAAVRFGNVLGSHGSVIPIFTKQIMHRGPVTVTHEEITRYFMTIPEAVGLILQAMTFAEGGEIFVLDMGEPVKIYDLAEKMIRLSGFEPNVDVPIEITGLRQGEKLYEELIVSEEGLSKTIHDKILVTKIMDFDTEKVKNNIAKLEEIVNLKEPLSNKNIKRVIKKIVPSFTDKDVEDSSNIEEIFNNSVSSDIDDILNNESNIAGKP